MSGKRLLSSLGLWLVLLVVAVNAHHEARRPGSLPASGCRIRSEQVHDPPGQALLAQHDVQLAAGGHLL